jgi:Ca2+-dependent lipid-binding protein
VAFINPPVLELDFTGAANVADFSLIDKSVRKVIISIINSIAVLPNRFLVNLDTANDYFKTFLEPIGVIRITVDKATGFAQEAQGKMKHLFAKMTRAAPDCYCNVDVGAEPTWKTTVKNNTTNPAWGETHDFVVSDFDQAIKIDVEDQDVGSDEEVGLGVTTVEELLQKGGKQELVLIKKGQETAGRVSIAAEFFKLEPDIGSFSSSSKGGDQLLGLAIILVAGAFEVQGNRKELSPSVKVSWGEKHHFQTTAVADAPGVDVGNPSFNQNFRIPITAEEVGSGTNAFKIELVNKEKVLGSVEVPYAEVQNAPGLALQKKFDMGGGTSVRASIALRGTRPAAIEDVKLAHRSK